MTKAAAQVRQLSMSVHIYAAESNDRLPADWDTLLRDGYFNRDLLASPFGPAPDGQGDFWLCTAFDTLGEVPRPDRAIMVYDRAMYLRGGRVVVGFFDGHVETMDWRELEVRAEQDPNRGRVDLP